MKISVITPSFNQAQFLPFNLQSVRLQKEVEVEHIIVDPGSTDGSRDIAQEALNIKMIAEPDRGQSDGICKGFSQATGDILVWLNSDDFYPDANVLLEVAKCFNDNPEVDIVYGDVNFVDEDGKFLRKGFINKNSDDLLSSFQYQVGIVQPGVFWRKHVFEEIGGPSEDFEYCMDYELWVRMASKGYVWKYIPKVLANHRWWAGMKTSSRRDLSLIEHFKVCEKYFGYIHWKWIDRFAEYLCSNEDGVVNHANDIDSEQKAKNIKSVINKYYTQEMHKNLSHGSGPEIIKTRQYLEKYQIPNSRYYYDEKDLDIVSMSPNDKESLERKAWNVFDVETSNKGACKAYLLEDNFERFFDKSWHAQQLERSSVAITKLSQQRRGDTCVIVGNGPSLKKSNLLLLENTDTIISNFAALNSELNRYGSILTVVNDLVAQQGALEFNQSHMIKFFPFWLANYLNEDENTFFVNSTVKPEFNENFVQSSSWRSTVSFFNMQLAYAIGYKKVLLIGFDHSYIQSADVKEGDVINQHIDDPNHFDARYFKGKVWQAADTNNMQKMYKVAKDFYEKNGREIVNCTVGGQLEVFRRGDLQEELYNNFNNHDQLSSKYPKILVIDPTPINHTSATGQLKKTFLGKWPDSSFMQVWENGGENQTYHTIKMNESIEDSQQVFKSTDKIVKDCADFNPDVIYFRPVDSVGLFTLTEQIIGKVNKPLVIHMMDDWPARLRHTNHEKHVWLDEKLRSIIDISSIRLSICDKMSTVYEQRYGGKWISLANGVDLREFPKKEKTFVRQFTKKSPFVFRYMGGLADDMTFDSVKDIAIAISELQREVPVCLEIYTMNWWQAKAEEEMGILPGVDVCPLVGKDMYKRILSEADALVLAYNFDPLSISYTGLSFANKLPECLASGSPVLAYGPSQVASIEFLKETNCVAVIDKRDHIALKKLIIDFVSNSKKYLEMGQIATSFVELNKTESIVQDKFHQHIAQACADKIIKKQSGIFSPSLYKDWHQSKFDTDDYQKFKNSDLSVKDANSLYREGEFEASMKVNLILYQKNGLKMYADNALMCAKKLKIAQGENVGQLMSLMK